MEQRQLGSNGPWITSIGFGAWAVGGANRFGWSGVSDDSSIRAIRRAVERGVNWIDTAAFYGKGHSEEVVARALEPFAVGDEVFVFTKCGLRWDADAGRDAPPTNDLSPASIRFECEQSLRRLAIEQIDLYQFHWPDQTGRPVEDSWATMAELVDEGKVRWIGVSNFDVDLLDRCERIRHVDSVQPPLSIIQPDAMHDVIPWARLQGTGVIVYSPIASGLLSGRFDRARAEALPEDDWRRDAPAFNEPQLTHNLDIVDRLRDMIEGTGITLPELAVAWTLSVPGVTGAIVGARTPDQVDGWIAAPHIDLEPDVRAEIDALVTTAGVSTAV